jgi:hypothetical protein
MEPLSIKIDTGAWLRVPLILNCALLTSLVTLLITIEVPSGSEFSLGAAGGSVTKGCVTGRGGDGAEGACDISVLIRFPTGRGVRWHLYGGAGRERIADSRVLNVLCVDNENILRFDVNVLSPAR